MKYRDEGAESFAKAEQFSAQWKELKKRRATSVSEERFVEINMAENPLTSGLREE